jgi:type I restriction enzyme, S subunit
MGLGKIGEALIDVAINQDLKAVLLGPGVDKQYFINCFKTLAVVGSGMTVAGIKQEELLGFVVPFPPVAEQSRIVTRVEELMRLCGALEAKGQLEATQHAQLVSTLLGTLTQSETPEQLTDNWHRIAAQFDLLLDRPQAVDALEQTILQLAVRGLLVPQDPQDEPASELLKKIRAEKDKLIAEGKIKRDKPLPPIAEDEQPFTLPQGWEWVRLNDLIRIGSGDGLTAAQMTPGGTIPVFGGNGINGYHDKANVDEPTLVIGRVGYYCGSVHITPPKAWVTDNAFITRYPKACLDMDWLYWLLVGTNLKENDSATAQPVISGRKLYPIVVALPPLAEQSRIVTRVAQLRRLCFELRQRLTASQSTQAHLAEALVAQPSNCVIAENA